MKLSEKLCARMKLADTLEKFIDDEDVAIQYLSECLTDENREHDSEVDDLARESIRIHKYAIDLAKDMLSQLDG